MKALKEIRRTPLRDVLPEEHFVMQLHQYMTDLRAEVNKVRLLNGTNWRWMQASLTYHVGRVHGLWYGVCNYLIFARGSHVYEECADLAAAARHECNFLTGPYMLSEAA